MIIKLCGDSNHNNNNNSNNNKHNNNNSSNNSSNSYGGAPRHGLRQRDPQPRGGAGNDERSLIKLIMCLV